MIHPYEWADYRLLVFVRNRAIGSTFLVNQMSQPEFMEHWMGMWDSDREKRIVEMSVMALTEDVFDMLAAVHEADKVLEG